MQLILVGGGEEGVGGIMIFVEFFIGQSSVKTIFSVFTQSVG